jgi:glutathione-specific gamma-glutamylcyclotransferase
MLFITAAWTRFGRRYVRELTLGVVKLTRESLLDGTFHASVRGALGPNVRYMTDAERAAQVEAILARAPRPRRIWVFAFGSLIWNPAFHFVERRTARIHGFHRQFCLWARAGRGSPERPGLMLSLVAGGSCTGVAYRIAARAAATELDVLWRREMGTMAYRPVWTTAHTPKGPEPAIAFSANREHERYVPGLEDQAVASFLATGAGPMGRCCDYLFDTVAHLRQLGIRDRRLEALEAKVRAHGARE